MAPFSIQATPNPNSLKFSSQGAPFIEEGMGVYGSAAEADADPFARALFSVPGVVNVFMLPLFVTITKAPEADWNAIIPALEPALRAHLER